MRQDPRCRRPLLWSLPEQTDARRRHADRPRVAEQTDGLRTVPNRTRTDTVYPFLPTLIVDYPTLCRSSATDLPNRLPGAKAATRTRRGASTDPLAIDAPATPTFTTIPQTAAVRADGGQTTPFSADAQP